MSLKKYLSLAVAGAATVVASSASAGGVEVAPAPSYSGFYIEGDIGYARVKWNDFQGGIFNPVGVGSITGLAGGTTSDGSGGFAWGGDVGYQFNQYFSAEMGAYSLPSVSGNVRTTGNPNVATDAAKVSSWLLYAAGKLSVPLFRNLDMFGKLGVAWRFLSYSGPGLALTDGATGQLNSSLFTNTHYAAVIFGTGMQYWLSPNWSLNLQYLHVPGRSKAEDFAQQSPNVNLIVGGVGYKFMS